jgi:hypothetical protein
MPVHIWTRAGRRPVPAAGTFKADIEMPECTRHPDLPTCGSLVSHDDPVREFTYRASSERVLARAEEAGWRVVCISGDWATVF